MRSSSHSDARNWIKIKVYCRSILYIDIVDLSKRHCRFHMGPKNLWPADKVMAEEIMDEIVEDSSEDYLPPRKIKNHEHIVQVTAVKFKVLKGVSSSDQTGAYPHMSARENRYIMIMENLDAGPILATAIKLRKKNIY